MMRKVDQPTILLLCKCTYIYIVIVGFNLFIWIPEGNSLANKVLDTEKKSPKLQKHVNSQPLLPRHEGAGLGIDSSLTKQTLKDLTEFMSLGFRH